MAVGVKTGGRQKGTPNKTTSLAKEAMSLAFEDMGGAVALTAWARENPTDFYKLWSKLLPQEIKAEHTGEVELRSWLLTQDS